VKYSILFLVLLTTPCFPEANEKPRCNAHSLGRFWPDEANTDSAFARQAARCGELEICSRGNWKYSWQMLTIHVSKLGKTRNNTVPGCDLKPGKSSEREASLK